MFETTPLHGTKEGARARVCVCVYEGMGGEGERIVNQKGGRKLLVDMVAS